MRDIKIKVDEIKIERIFGYTTEADYMSDLQAENAYGKRLRYLSYLFLDMLNQSPERMYGSFMMSKVLSGLSGHNLNKPTKVIKYLNDKLDNDALENIFRASSDASHFILGKEGLSMDELMKEFKDGKES